MNALARTKSLLAYLLLFLSLTGIFFFQGWKKQARLSDHITFEFNEKFMTFSPEVLRGITFGYSRAASSLLWLRFLYHTPPRKVEVGQVSWIFLDLTIISTIDPDFYPTYERGGIFLSVITEDKLGAEKILLQGVERFPNSWRLRAYLAYHYAHELLDPTKAGQQYYIGMNLPGAPSLFRLRAASYLSDSGKKEEGISLLREMYRSSTDPILRKHLEKKALKLGGRLND
jgi:hypothetical protein